MSRKPIILAIALLAALLCGCRKDDALAVKFRSNTLLSSKYLTSTATDVFFSVSASGDWSLELEFPDGGTPWASAVPSHGSGRRDDVILRCQANPSSEPRTIRFVVSSASGGTAIATCVQAGKPAAAVMGTYGQDVGAQEWLELPAMTSGDGRELLVHDMNGGKYVKRATDDVRNWSCYWDGTEKMSLWVAYPLNNSLRGSGSRTNQWGFDALLPEDQQPNLTKGSYGGGWTRGHMLPSADRLTEKANISTFIPTNLTPQENGFNGGIWADLEGKVRAKAQLADTLYVVTGALFDNSTTTTGTYSGYAVKVPTHFFKALLYSGKSVYARSTEGFLMTGYFLPHESAIAGDNIQKYRVSIDELEEKTGIDFFPMLERMNPGLSKQLEAAGADTNTRFWN